MTGSGSSAVHLNYRRRPVEDTNYLLSAVFGIQLGSAGASAPAVVGQRCNSNYYIHSKVGPPSHSSIAAPAVYWVELQEARGLRAALDVAPEPINFGIMRAAPRRAACKLTTDHATCVNWQTVIRYAVGWFCPVVRSRIMIQIVTLNVAAVIDDGAAVGPINYYVPKTSLLYILHTKLLTIVSHLLKSI